MAYPRATTRRRAMLRPAGAVVVGVVGALSLSGAGDPSGERTTVPDFSGAWQLGGNAFDFAPPLAGVGAGPLVNTSGDRLVPIGNYDSPILQPWAATEVKKHGDTLRATNAAPDAHTWCDPMGVPYVLQVRDTVQFLQTPDWITIIYQNDNQRRQVHLNAQHSARPAPSWFGESIGHYEGDTLVIDTTGIGVHQVSAIDRFGTPHTEAMHVVERYRRSDDGKMLRGDFTVDDPGTFTTPWHASVTYRAADPTPGEHICAENNRDTSGELPTIPKATKADF